jgi:hypothetical protein
MVRFCHQGNGPIPFGSGGRLISFRGQYKRTGPNFSPNRIPKQRLWDLDLPRNRCLSLGLVWDSRVCLMGCVLACLILWFLRSALGFHQWYVGMCYNAPLMVTVL